MIDLPLSLVRPVRLSDATPAGVFLSHKPSDPLMLAFPWGGKAHLMHLEGKHAFTHFTLQPGYSARGTVITEIQFLVDLSSRYDAVEKHDPLGALVLRDGDLFVIGQKAGDTFSDPHEVPLWGDYEDGTSEEAVGFARWSIFVRDGKERKIIWSQPPEEE